MKIVKVTYDLRVMRRDKIIFDTAAPDYQQAYHGETGLLIPLQMFTGEKTVHKFLSGHFTPEHPAFEAFGASYYYHLND